MFYGSFAPNGSETTSNYPPMALPNKASPLPQCSVTLPSNTPCPLEYNATQYCNSWNTATGYTTAIWFNITLSNPCPPNCYSDVAASCKQLLSDCMKLAGTYNNPMQLQCGCYQQQYACLQASGCFSGYFFLSPEISHTGRSSRDARFPILR